VKYTLFNQSDPDPGEFLLKPLRQVGRALGSESANGSYSTWYASWERQQLTLLLLTDEADCHLSLI